MSIIRRLLSPACFVVGITPRPSVHALPAQIPQVHHLLHVLRLQVPQGDWHLHERGRSPQALPNHAVPREAPDRKTPGDGAAWPVQKRDTGEHPGALHRVPHELVQLIFKYAFLPETITVSKYLPDDLEAEEATQVRASLATLEVN